MSCGLFVSMANIPQVPGGHKLVYWPIGDIVSMHHNPVLVV